MKKLDELIRLAIQVADCKLTENGKISKKYNGYISSFGASVTLSGLFPSIAFYENKNAESADMKNRLMQAILTLIAIRDATAAEFDSLINFAFSRMYPTAKQEILDAATALKLAIRTFELIDVQEGA